ncbi:hypothetical protein RSAG8_05620, partial [Rhizoctonia solani AG-8 WAC10335]
MPRTNHPHFKKRPSDTSNNSQPHSNVESTVDETSIGLYDYPPNDVQSREYASGRRKSRSTERNLQYRAESTVDETSVGLYDYPPNDVQSREYASGRRKSCSTERNLQYRAERASQEQKRQKSNETRARNKASRSEDESKQPTQASENTQYTYEYETLTHEGLVQYAKDNFNLDVQDCDTHTILELLELAEAEQASQMGPSRIPSSIVMLSPTPLGAGGGWSQRMVGGKRCGSQVSIPSNDDGAGKPRRKVTVEEVEDVDAFKPQGKVVPGDKLLVEEDMATESETDDEPVQTTNSAARLAAEHILAGCTGDSTRLNGRPPQRGTHAPHPTRDNTPATILDSQPLNPSSHSLGGSLPQHHPDSRSQQDGLPTTDFDMASDGSGRATYGSARTYAGTRSHRLNSLPRSMTLIAKPADADTTVEELPRPNSPSLTPAELLRRERARSAKTLNSRSSHLATPNTEPPITRPQPRPPLGSKGNAIGRATGGTRRRDSASATRNDLTAFNRAVAQDQAASLIANAKSQSKRTADHSTPPSHADDELLEDDEEMSVQAAAYAKRTWPLRASRIRKPKPLARDVSGIDRQVLTMAKIHLFAYALIHGIYQTRSRFLQWASDVHEATAQVELPDQPYNRPEHEIYEIMVNSIATRRGKAKELLREFVARVSGFRQNLKRHKVIQRNEDIFNQLYPNNFHCLESNPRRGDYEHPEIRVLYPEYFQDMPLTAVTFCLAIWQFCLEEWANGWCQNGDLGAGAMREKYEAHLAGLNELRRVAPRRMSRLQNEWIEYVIDYSGALLGSADQHTTDFVGPPQMRPDTPEPDNAISVEELNSTLFETARQESIRDCLAQIAAQELAAPMDVDEDLGTSAPPSRAPSPALVEYNEHGVLTAQSKGKGRAN